MINVSEMKISLRKSPFVVSISGRDEEEEKGRKTKLTRGYKFISATR